MLTLLNFNPEKYFYLYAYIALKWVCYEQRYTRSHTQTLFTLIIVKRPPFVPALPIWKPNLPSKRKPLPSTNPKSRLAKRRSLNPIKLEPPI